MTRINLPTERRVGHLTLIRHGRNLSVPEYNLLSTTEQLDMIHQARGKQKYDLLLNAEQAEFLTQQLHPQELYLTVNELGAEYAVDLLALANAEQINTLLDLDCWNDDNLSDVLSLHWLDLLLNTGEEQICKLAHQIEPELLALFLKKHLTIIRGLEVYDDDSAENAKRLESLYDINYASEDAAKIIGAMLQILQQKEQEQYLLIMEMIRSETFSVLEEEVYTERNKRLLDLGFFPTHEANEIYSYIDPQSFVAGGKERFSLEAENLQHPGAILAYANPGALLAEILAANNNPEVASELCLLANRKMSADQIDTASAEAVSETLQSVYDTLNLALEFLAGTDLAKADKIFTGTYLLHLFQLGGSLVKQRQSIAQKLLTGPLGPLFDVPEQVLLESLLEQPACLFQQASDDLPGQVRPIKTCNDLTYVDVKLEQIGALENFICNRLNFSPAELADAVDINSTLSSLVLTAVANQILNTSFDLQPIPHSKLGQLKLSTFEQDDLSQLFTTKLQKTLCAETDELLFFAKYCLECWFDDFTLYDPRQPNMNLPDCLILEA